MSSPQFWRFRRNTRAHPKMGSREKTSHEIFGASPHNASPRGSPFSRARARVYFAGITSKLETTRSLPTFRLEKVRPDIIHENQCPYPHTSLSDNSYINPDLFWSSGKYTFSIHNEGYRMVFASICEQSDFFCEQEQRSNLSCEQRALKKIQLAKS